MATIVNSMDRAISNSKKHNQIKRILMKSLFIGMVGYSIFILTLIEGFHLVTNLFKFGPTQINSTVLILSSIGYLALYSFLLIKELKINNFYKLTQRIVK
jgi:hypothetical protein